MDIVGTVVRLEFEGGFWGIVADSGAKYDVGELPTDLRVEGLRIRARLERSSRISFRMWGRAMELLDIEPIEMDLLAPAVGADESDKSVDVDS